ALLRLGLFPLQRVTRAMTTTDLLRPSPRPEVAGTGGIPPPFGTFKPMLDPLGAQGGPATPRPPPARSR
ncbi:hypothetical protein ADK56_06025, partial [Streptomyces sp. MMG1522]